MSSEGMRLDELARRAGVASTTVRLYQAKGLLPGPRLVGRTGWYDERHLTRLGLVARLQEQGFSLAGIARLLDSWEQGRDLAELVGVEEQLDALLHSADDVALDPADFTAHFPADTLTPDLVERAVALGLVEALVRLGLPAAVLLDEWERLVARTDEIAERFVGLFTQHLAPAGWEKGLDGETTERLADTLAQLRRQAGQVLLTAFDASMARKARESLAALLDEPER